MKSRQILRNLARPAMVAAVYYCVARLSLTFIAQPESLPVFWAPAGLLLGILVVSLRRDWRWILPLAFLTHFAAELSYTVDLRLAAGFSMTEMFGASLGAWLLQRVAGDRITLDNVRSVLALILLPILVSNPVSATLGASIRMAGSGHPSFWDSWLLWWTSTSLGITVVTPVVLTWPAVFRGFRSASRWRVAEGVLLSAVTLAACMVIFALPAYRGLVILPLLCLPVPLFMWAAARFGPIGVAHASVVFSTFGLWQTIHNRGAIAAVAGRVEQNVLMFQIYLAVLICFSLLLSATIVQQQRALRAMRESEVRYRALVEYLPVGITVSVDDILVYVNPAGTEIVGAKKAEELVGRSIWEFVHEDFQELVKQRRAQLLSSRASNILTELKLRRLDGSLIDVEGAGIVIEFDGKPAIQDCIRDITERKQGEEQLKSTSDQLRALMADLRTAREQEGIRISREIHDELGSAFTSLRWDLEVIDKMVSEAKDLSLLPKVQRKIETMLNLIDATINVVRRISSELRPSILDDLGLVEAVEWQLQQFQARSGITCRFTCGVEDLEFDPDQSTAIFRIFQEALTNVLRHAEATLIDVALDEDGTDFVLQIRDNGIGFTEDPKGGALSLGLLGMRERAQLIGGKIEMAGIRAEGTTITLRVPCSGTRSG
jgi:PAS domain S-box-containing protein